MSTTQPIRNQKLLHAFKDYYRSTTPNIRNYTLIILGLNTALRISDVLCLTWDDIFDDSQMKKHLTIREQKTGKENCIFLNSEVQQTLQEYACKTNKTGIYLFPSPTKQNAPLSRYQAYRIIRSAAEHVGLDGHISCHSLRKTFGYQAWKQGVQPALLMNIYNHSSYRITLKYLCIEQDDKDEVFERIRL